MINKKIVFALLLLIFNNVFAYKDDPEVFQIVRNDEKLTCAEIDQEKNDAFCWSDASKGFVKLQVNKLERREVQEKQYLYGSYHFYDPTIYIDTLRKLAVDALAARSEILERELLVKIRALGAEIYIYHGHEDMVDICNSLPARYGIRRLVESCWDGIGRWLG